MAIRLQVIKQLQRALDRLKREVAELKEGGCRYHCTTSKENFRAGYRAALARFNLMSFDNDAEDAYNEWKRRQATTR